MASRDETDRTETSREDAENAAAAWIARREEPQWSAADAAALEAWLAESASHRAAYYRLNSAWTEAGRLGALTRAPAKPRPVASRPRHFRRPLAWAASVAAVALAGVALYESSLLSHDHYTTGIGGLESVPLADGSRITLNTDSELQVALDPKERVVNLKRGEAYFEVAKDPSRPFIVNAGPKRVIAVGTQFSVLRERDEVRVVVSEGTVRLEGPGGGSGARAVSAGEDRNPPPSSGTGSAEVVLLPAGTIARARHDAVLIQKEAPDEIQQHLSWRSGLLTFRDTSLEEAVVEFNRYNERKIVIEDPAIASIQLGGVFRSTNVDPFIELLEQGFPVRATREGNRIVLTHN